MSRGGRPSEQAPAATPERGRGRTVAFGAAAVVIALLIGLLVWQPWSGDDGDAPGDAMSTSTPGDPSDDVGGSEPSPADDVPIGTVATDRPGGACAAVIERLAQYSEAAKESTPQQLRLLFEKLSEFEHDVFTFAQGEEWGDQVIAELVVVRRLWVDAGSAEGRGDSEDAERIASEANAKLDALVEKPPCP
jgi:hypothetical protein